MTWLRLMVLPGLVGLAAACGEGSTVNPPTEPARAIEDIDPVAPVDNGTISLLPGRGAASFVGRWAADVAWCVAPNADGRPIEITPTRFEGYENSCAITRIEEVADGYVAALACEVEGASDTERAKFSVTGDVLRLMWLDRPGAEPVVLRQCTTLSDNDPAAPAL